ncbi:MAG: PqqD family protein [Bacteroidaceae bacterium]|nr:PqqD family protein [Bacteroidaceae bacterium]
MKKKPGFELRDVCGEKLIIAHGLQNLDFSKMINLNETAAFIWEQLPEDAPFETDELVEALLGEYDVEREVALHDVKALLAQWKEVGLIED